MQPYLESALLTALTLIPATPPTIITQPVDSTGAPLTVVATGFGILTYQWYRTHLAGGDIADGDATATTSSFSPDYNDGYYYCIVSNEFGSVTSNTVRFGALM